MGHEKLLDVREVAAFLGVPPGWVYAKAASGELPSIRLGLKYIRFDPAAVQEYLERQRREPTDAART